MKHLQSLRVSATFVAEPIEASLRFWLSTLGQDAAVTFAPFNQVFQELFKAASQGHGANLYLVRPEDWLGHPQPDANISGMSAAGLMVESRHQLPNGIEVAELNRAETDHLYREIFHNRAYLRCGVRLDDDAVVVDCGANIGMFSLFAHLHARRVRILAIEPSPPTARVLRVNAALHAMDMTVAEVGLGERDETASFTFYENYSLVSGFSADAGEDEAFLRAAIHATLSTEASNTHTRAVGQLTDHLVAERMQRSESMLPVRRLGGLLRELGLRHIDLLKIDVEKAERQVLAGIDDDQWPLIQQIVMEIHDTGDAIPSTVQALEERGFSVHLEEERDLQRTGVWNLFAIRPEYKEAGEARDALVHEQLMRSVRDMAAAAMVAATRSNAPHVFVLCPPSPAASAKPGASGRQAQIAAELRDRTRGASNVVVWDAQDLSTTYRCPQYYDGRSDLAGHMPYSTSGYDALGAAAARAIHVWAKAPTKIVVVDCDNTLWSGVCAEDGPAGVQINQSHRRLHERLRSLGEAGVLLALNSKNEPADVWAVFDSRRDDLGISRDHFITSRLNWHRKSANLRDLAEELDIGLDSMVFLDDNPVECAEVSITVPDVTVLQWPTSEAKAAEFLDHLWPLDVGPATAEDRTRADMYRQEARRRALLGESSSLEAFLANLALEITIAPVTPADLPRAAQLTERTNQFNFTTIRRTEGEIRTLIESGADVLIMHVKDRFGDYGLVGLAVAMVERPRGRYVVDTFLMSCRVLGKGVEHRLLAELGARALARGVSTIELPFEPTARNRPAWQFATSAAGSDSLEAPTARVFTFGAADTRQLTYRPQPDATAITDTEDNLRQPAAGAIRPDYQRIATELATTAGISAAVHPVSAATMSASYVAPATATERQLARIWSDLLHRERIGRDDSFFALGGDSIVAIQVLSRAAQAGLAFSMKDLFEHDTIRALAAAVGTDRSARVVADPPSEPGAAVSLTPIQRWFFDKALPNPHHWNMEMVIASEAPVDADVLERSLRALVAHHEALRYRFSHTEAGWRQHVVATECASLVELVQLPVDEGSAAHQIASAVAGLHAGLRIDTGPLLRAAVLLPHSPGTIKIVLVAHHLVCDGVTWRVLLEDLETAYSQVSAGHAPALSSPGTTYRRWADVQAALAPSLTNQLTYWQSVVARPRQAIAVDPPDGTQAATESTLTISPTWLSADETRRILVDAPRALDTHINDVLLGALAVAFQATFGIDDLLVDLEGHGREPLDDELNLSRTVGWFTTVFPVHISARGGDVAGAVADARAMRLGLPRRGIGYGILRYLHPESFVRESLSVRPPEVMFNYLGQFDAPASSDARFRWSPDVDLGPLHGPNGLRSHLFEIIARVVGGRLRFDWMYSRALFAPATIDVLLGHYMRSLRQLLALVDHQTSGLETPRVRAIRERARGRNVGTVQPLSPIQELFLLALDGGQSVGLDQWCINVVGGLDLSAFERAWRHAVDSHEIFRTMFVNGIPGGPGQAVVTNVTLGWKVEDLCQLTEPEHSARIEDFLEEDRAEGFDPTNPPLMRVALFRLAADSWELVWTFHHLAIDGWSCPLVFGAVADAYDAIAAKRPLPTSQSSYARYIQWLGEHPKDQSEAFWRAYLSGFRAPTALASEAPATRLETKTERLSVPETMAVGATARDWRVSVNTLVQLAWALVLSKYANASDVVFGVAFSGRPGDLAGVEGIIGPFVNDLPVRVKFERTDTLRAAAQALQADQFSILPHQGTPPTLVHQWSDVPASRRLFDSLLVLQSEATAAGLRRLGSGLEVARINAPVRTNYPITVVAVPGSELTLEVIANPGVLSVAGLEAITRSLAAAIRAISTPGTVGSALDAVTAPTRVAAILTPRIRRETPAAPATAFESQLAAIWRAAFGIDDIGVNETFHDLGGQSLLMLKIHVEIERTLDRNVSIVSLFQHPTIRALAAHLEAPADDMTAAQLARDRAARQQDALARQRRRP